MIFLSPSRQIVEQYLQTGHDSLFPNPFLFAVHGRHPVALHEAETPAIISLQTKESSTWFLHTMSPPPLSRTQLQFYSTSRQKPTLSMEQGSS
jgi:hypothetical protein